MRLRRNKKEEHQENIAAAMTSIDDAVGKLKRVSKLHENWIDEEIMNGNDARAKELILAKIAFDEHAKYHESLKRMLLQSSVQAEAMSALGGLNDVIKGLGSLMGEIPDFDTLKKNTTKVFSELRKQEAALAKYSEEFKIKPTPKSAMDSGVEGEDSEAVRAELAAANERVRAKLAANKSNSVIAPTPTGGLDIDAIEKVIEEENKK